MNRKGIDTIRRETDEKAGMLYNFLKTSEKYSIAVRNSAHQSPTVIVANVANPTEKIAALKEKGMVIGSGYGSYKESQVRIASFPATSAEQIARLICLMD